MSKPEQSRSPARLFRRLIRKEDGAMTVLALYLTATMFILGGLAVDVAYLITSRTQLRVAADIAAHTALFQVDYEEDHDIAKQKALAMAKSAMPTVFYGEVIKTDDIKFGHYDPATFTFTEDATSREAVMVEAFRISERSNTVASFILQMIGKDEWDLVVPSVFETYRPTCFREGFVGDGVVDVQSNNAYSNGFCIHSNTHVSVNTNNFYEPGTIVSMPDMDNIELPRSGYSTNDGLQAAMREGRYQIHILNRIQAIYAGMTNDKSRYYRDYLINDTAVPITLPGHRKVTPGDLKSKRVNVINCSAQGMTLESGIYSEVVIIGNDCNVTIQNGVQFINATLITTDTSDKSIDAPNGLILGADDNCADGGGAQFVTWGGIHVAAGLEMYGSQMIAKGPIYFQANADGIQGASIISGETIEGNSNTSFAFCGTGMDNNFQAEYFRMRA